MDLKDYVNKAKEKGYSKEEIINLLTKKGYSNYEIQDAFGNSKKIVNKNNDFIEIPFFEKIKLMFSDPRGIFENFRDKTIIKSLVMYASVALVFVILAYFVSSLMGGIIYKSRMSYLGYSFAISFGLYIFSIIATFIVSGLTHIAIKLYKGEGNFTDTYNVVTYSMVPAAILSIIPFFGFIGYIYALVLIVFGFSVYHKISYGKAVVAALMPLIIVVIIIILIVIAIGKMHIFSW
jgi:hypothetical protein